MTKRSLASVIRRTFKPLPTKQWRDHVEAVVEKRQEARREPLPR